MFDPKKYDRTNSDNSSEAVSSFIMKRISIIQYLSDVAPIINSECKFLEDYTKKNPTANATKAFLKKLDGWSRILNGLEIVKNMYGV